MAGLSQRDLFEVGRAEAVSGPTKFDRAIIDTDGSDVNVIFNVSATMGEESAAYTQRALNALRLATASGEDLDRLVWDLYQIRRKDEAPAVVTLRLSRSSGGSGFSIPAGSPFGTTTGQVYTTVVPAAFSNGSNGPIDVLAVAEVSGEGGNVPDGVITVIQGSFPDATLVVTNPEKAAGGSPRQSDESFKDTARQFYTTARRGTKSAIEFGAIQVPQVAQAAATEVLDPTAGLPVYRVQLIVSDLQGQANSALAASVVTELDEYRALGVPVLVVPATPQYVTVKISGVAFSAGTSTAQALADAKALIVALVNNLRPGATLYRSQILSAIGPLQVPGLIVPEGALVEPAGDLVPTTGTVIRTSLDRVEVTS